jgi:hypothetical protein
LEIVESVASAIITTPTGAPFVDFLLPVTDRVGFTDYLKQVPR